VQHLSRILRRDASSKHNKVWSGGGATRPRHLPTLDGGNHENPEMTNAKHEMQKA